MKQNSIHFSLLVVVIHLFCSTVINAENLQPAKWRLALNSGWGSNTFSDSLADADQYLALDVGVEKEVLRHWAVYYSGKMTGYQANQDLGNAFHGTGIQADFSFDKIESLWMQAGGFAQKYGEEFSIYNKNRLFASLGMQARVRQSLRLRAITSISQTEYSSLVDNTSPANREFFAALGLNVATQIPLAVDIELGYQQRSYNRLTEASTVAYTYSKLRLSRPITDRLGLKVYLNLRKQMTTELIELNSLYDSGIDPGDLLWDGSQLGSVLSVIHGKWKTALRAELLLANFVETLVLDGSVQRRDRGTLFSVESSRSLKLDSLPFRARLTASLSVQRNHSSAAFYDYSAASIGVKLGLSSLR